MSTLESKSILQADELACAHCELPVLTPYTNEENNIFCCRGCLSVYEIIKNNNLQTYYTIQNSEDKPNRAVQRLAKKEFSYLDEPSFLKDYLSFNCEDEAIISFYIEGVHCLACLWLIEKLPSLVPEVKSARLNFESSVVKITLKKDESSFSNVAQSLNNLGYAPTPLRSDDDIKQLQKKEERGYLLKMGVAAACMMNITLYAIGLYAGAQGTIGSLFSFIALAFCTPVVFYSAQPFYISSITALKKGSVNIDTPLSIAIALGFSISVYNVIIGSQIHYFDSIATLTFLILFSRYLLLKASRHSFSKNDLHTFLTDTSVLRRNSENQLEDIHHSQIKIGDTILVSPGASFPCDAKIIKGKSEISLAILNGESRPLEHKEGMPVFMGTVNLGATLELEVTNCGEDTRLGQIYAKAEASEKKKSSITLLSDRISKYFVSSVLLLAIATTVFFIFQGQIEVGINRALALIIITCPCALGLATPLTYSRLINLGAKLGALIKSEYVLEKLSTVENIFFDKTGTLTKGDYRVSEVQRIQEVSIPFTLEDIIFSMEANSNHPVALCLIDWSKHSATSIKRVPFTSSLETLGKGIQATLNGKLYEIRSTNSTEQSLQISLFENTEAIAHFFLKDQIKKEASSIISYLKSNSYQIFMASGDQRTQVEAVANQLDLQEPAWRSNMSPEEKGDWVNEYTNTLFIGDGVNDTLAFSKSNTSIAIKGSLEVGLSSSEVFLKNCDIDLIPSLLMMAKAGTRTVKRNLGFSLIYNSTGAVLALLGLVGPLEAAILMPLSSLTVLLSSLLGTRASLFLIKGN